MQAAAYILVKRGWEGFTTNEVARKAGVNIASLYQYFPNKSAIVAELQRRHVDEVRQRWPAPEKGLPLRPSVRAMLEAVIQEHRVNPALHRVFAEELPRVARQVDELGTRQAQWAAHVKSQMRVPDERLAAFITRVVVHAVVHEAATERPEWLDHPLFVSELTRLLAGYLSGR